MKMGLWRAVAFVGLAAILGSASFAQDEPSPVRSVEGYPEHLIYLVEGVGGPAGSAQVWAPRRKWEVGRTLRVCFFNGNSVVKHLIAKLAVEWTGPHGANLVLDFGRPPEYRDCLSGTGGGNIRISFGSPGRWSLIGNEAEEYLTTLQASMNFYALDAHYRPGSYTVDDVVRRARPDDRSDILHEFGHALGLLHEHQNPQLNCRDEILFDGPRGAYEILRREVGWNPDMVDRNLRPVTDLKVGSTLGNLNSIMMYALDERFLRSGRDSPCYVPTKNGLHPSDLATVAQLYPHNQVAVPQPDDLSFPPFQLSALPTAAGTAAHALFRRQILNDLQDDDAYVRRDARGRLAEYFENAPAAEIERIVSALPTETYRYQLGVAVALERSGTQLPRDLLSPLSAARRESTDRVLTNALREAIRSASE